MYTHLALPSLIHFAVVISDHFSTVNPLLGLLQQEREANVLIPTTLTVPLQSQKGSDSNFESI